jgi:hypothetical protein
MGSLKEKLHSYKRRGKERAGQGCVLQPFGRNARSQLREPALSSQRPQPGGGSFFGTQFTWNARSDAWKNMDCPHTRTCSNTCRPLAGNTSTSPQTTFGAKTSVLNMANSDLCDHSRGLSR